MKHLDLFSGIGGFALAARWVGWETVGFCEIDPWAQKVLAKHWPGVPIYDDIKTIVADTGCSRVYERWQFTDACSENNAGGNGWDGVSGKQKAEKESAGYITDGTTTVGPVDIITGGFPCQDISHAGKGAGIEGERSGLWTELARIIGEVRPRYAVLENVAALLSRGLDRVAGDLAEIGYDCEWHCIPASAVGAPHRRDRIWIVAYPNSQSLTVRSGGNATKRSGQTNTEPPQKEGADVTCDKSRIRKSDGAADTNSERGRGWNAERQDATWLTEPNVGLLANGLSAGLARPGWLPEPGVGRIATGVPDRTQKLKGLGNAIVPHVAEVIFRAIDSAQTGRDGVSES